ncbi:MAG: CoA ester lyase [Hyphomicrobiales bacterium]|nr:CoA ester lyase [Hyphomicrobiales bacterium]
MVYYHRGWQVRRSVLFMPASNRRVLVKAHDLDCDGVIFDLEDSVSDKDQAEARKNLLELVGGRDFGRKETIIRVSSPDSTDYFPDIDVAIACSPDAILVPKVETADVLHDLSKALDGYGANDIDIWAMIETPRAIINLREIASANAGTSGRLNCLVVGPNDLARETGVPMVRGRAAMIPWLMDVVAHGRTNGLVLLDGVYNAFGDGEGLIEECLQGVSMGFDGKTLIHPLQIDHANRIFSPSKEQIKRAKLIIDLFQKPENLHKNALQLDGEMVERLHFDNAKNLLEQVDRFT